MGEAVDASRRAVLAFLEMEPDKPSLAAWLVGPYREATRFGPRRIHGAHSHAANAVDHATAMNIEDIVDTSKAVVAAALAAAQRGVDDLVELLPAVVQVRPVHDAHGNRGFVPVDEAHMRLADRVLALLVAVYLTRPDDLLAVGSSGASHVAP